MKKITWTIMIIVLILIIGFLFLVLRGSEDDWLRDSKGIYIKHGVPKNTPDYVKEQQDAVSCATSLYNEAKASGMQFSSQCLGTCENYAIDIVNTPRNNEDNKIENQCQDFREGKVKNFIELDKNGDIVRIID